MGNEGVPVRLPRYSLNQLMRAASEEKWQIVDKAIPSVCDRPKFIGWAWGTGVDEKDPNLRDLAVSLIEKSPFELKTDQTEKLAKIMGKDENHQIRARAAFALFTHGTQTPEVIEIINRALQDEELREVAQGYLDSLNK